jgi:hypothetical protein
MINFTSKRVNLINISFMVLKFDKFAFKIEYINKNVRLK